MPITHDNVIYISNISKLGRLRVEAFTYYMVKEYAHLDIAVVCKTCDIKQMERLKHYAPVYVHHGEEIQCKVMVINYDTSILDYVTSGKVYMVVHGDYTQPNYKVYPNFNHPKIYKILTVTQTLADRISQKFGIECECCYNPFVPEKKEKRIQIVSATRLSAIKGAWRMKALAEELDRQNVNYIWYVFTNDADCIHSPNVVFLPPRLDVYKWIQESDILCQLSDTEAMSYSINEARAYGVQTCTTRLPYLEEININDDNAIILEFNCSNIKEVVEKIKKVKKVNWEIPKDNYKNILAEGKSKYEEMKKGMAKVKIVARVRDMQAGGQWREVGDIFEVELARAKQFVASGYGVILEENIEKKKDVVEKAIKEEKKEKAVKEKATKKVEPKATRKYAKK